MATSNEVRITSGSQSSDNEPVVLGPEPTAAILTEPRVQIEFDPQTSTYRIGLAVAV
ncbi:MAG: hypothetical protein WBA45_03395 [Microthrixaceae bacterium]